MFGSGKGNWKERCVERSEEKTDSWNDLTLGDQQLRMHRMTRKRYIWAVREWRELSAFPETSATAMVVALLRSGTTGAVGESSEKVRPK